MKNPIKNFIRKIVTSELDKPPQNAVSTIQIVGGVDELNEVYLFDFKLGYRNQGNTAPINMPTGNQNEGDSEEKTTKIRVKPVDVFNELERTPKGIDLELLDEKIAILKDKIKFIKQYYTKREVDAMIERLEFRKKYDEYKDFFNQFDNTDELKIKKFTHTHDLVMETADIFIPDFPNDAIEIMKSYDEKVVELTGKKPVFYVIAEKELFDYSYDKRDPILLVQSPFGFYYQILGAWDKELMYLSEL